MRVNVFSCLLAFVLAWNVTAEILHVIIKEKQSITLPCPRPVAGDVTWSRETRGSKVDILKIVGDSDIPLVPDPFRRYSSLADKSLHIIRASVSHTGKYFCNDEAAAELTVIPSGTIKLTVPENTTVTLLCPRDVRGSNVPRWSRDVRGKETRENIESRGRFHVSTEGKTLKMEGVQPGDSGLYYCDGEEAADLMVTEAVVPGGGYRTTAATPTQTKPEIFHVIIKEKQSITLPCPRPVAGDVTWSRETRGSKVDVLKIVGDSDIRLVPDPFRRYSSLADKSLHIFKASVSHTGKYFCNDEAAAELTVIPSGGVERCT